MNTYPKQNRGMQKQEKPPVAGTYWQAASQAVVHHFDLNMPNIYTICGKNWTSTKYGSKHSILSINFITESLQSMVSGCQPMQFEEPSSRKVWKQTPSSTQPGSSALIATLLCSQQRPSDLAADGLLSQQSTSSGLQTTSSSSSFVLTENRDTLLQ